MATLTGVFMERGCSFVWTDEGGANSNSRNPGGSGGSPFSGSLFKTGLAVDLVL